MLYLVRIIVRFLSLARFSDVRGTLKTGLRGIRHVELVKALYRYIVLTSTRHIHQL
jgi:hypothetical protein